MESGTLLPSQEPSRPDVVRRAGPRTEAVGSEVPASGPDTPRRAVRLRTTLAEPIPDEPLAVTVAGPAGSGRGAVLGALLGMTGPVLAPADRDARAFVVVRHAEDRATVAFLPGRREPQPYDPTASGNPPARPPRRIEVSLPDPLLRHFALVDAPDTDDLGPAGTRVLLDVAARGALLFVLAAGRHPDRPEIGLLTEAARTGVPVLFAVTPAPDGGGPAGAGGTVRPAGDGDAGGPAALRAAVAAAVPALAGAPWFAVDPAGADPAALRRALVEWAGVADLRRAAQRASVRAGAARTVRVAAGAPDSDWAARLDRLVRSATHLARQRLVVEVAGIHLRVLRDLVADGGPAGLPDRLDRELHALSLRARAGSESYLARIVDETVGHVFDRADPDVRHRLFDGVRRGLSDDPAAADLERVLLVTTTAGVASLTGPAAVAALAAYPVPAGRAVLPPFGVALSAGCYRQWRDADQVRARGWLQRVVRAVEVELLAETSRRYDAAGRSLALLLAEAVDHGILLA